MGSPLTKSDLQLIGILILATALAFPMASMAGGHGDGTATIGGPYGQEVVSLSEDARYVIQGREGTVVFETADGSLYCVESSCREQICVKQHEVLQGRPVVCAPNGVSAMMTTSRESDDDLDAVSR